MLSPLFQDCPIFPQYPESWQGTRRQLYYLSMIQCLSFDMLLMMLKFLPLLISSLLLNLVVAPSHDLFSASNTKLGKSTHKKKFHDARGWARSTQLNNGEADWDRTCLCGERFCARKRQLTFISFQKMQRSRLTAGKSCSEMRSIVLLLLSVLMAHQRLESMAVFPWLQKTVSTMQLTA